MRAALIKKTVEVVAVNDPFLDVEYMVSMGGGGGLRYACTR